MATIYVDKPDRDGLNPRQDKDSYLTQPELAHATISWMADNLSMGYVKKILDPGAGTGVWGKAARWRYRNLAEIDGVEIRRNKNPGYYNNWYPRTDYLKWPISTLYDLIIGNPPFKLAEAFVRKSLSSLNHLGWLCFLLPSDFAHTQGRARGLFTEHPPEYLLSLAERPVFTGPSGQSLGNANPNNYSLFLWQNLFDKNVLTTWRPFLWKTKN